MGQLSSRCPRPPPRAVSYTHLAHPDSSKEPAPLIRLSEFGDSALEIAVRVWTEPAKVFPLKYDLLEEIKRTFDREGIPIAYPHLDVTLGK